MTWNDQTKPQWGQPPVPPSTPPGARPAWARKRVVIPSALGLFFVGVIIGSAGSSGAEITNSAKPAPEVTVAVTVTAEPKPVDVSDDKPADPVEKAKPTAEGASKETPVPDFVGMGLQSAQDTAQAKGFYGLTSHDSLGRDRMQAFDRNWKVCSQNIKAGKTVSTETGLDFGAVKLEEDCPVKDQQPLESAGDRMPDLAGQSVKAARGALDSGTSVTVTDAAEDRMVLMESNWKVCTQAPGPGVKLKGQPVELTAVKFEEACP
ncbi:hypothetical protein [Streptomyces anulatus]|uniref:hypothetical protein n=1 Tax=Streptomyces anulatus TaxID=1892 RepID=UPI0036B1ED69